MRSTLPSEAGNWTTRAGAPLVFAGMWMLGCGLVLVRCIVAHVTVARLVAASAPLAGPIWARRIADTAHRIGVRRRVTVVVSDAVGGPVTSGVVRPVILLPADAPDWSDERADVVLLHEMAHVARLDYVAQLVATAATALFWFHPAVWAAASWLRTEAEHAADDRVLSAGLASDRYATHLVELARRAAIGEPAAVAVGIAHRTPIERRIRAMLDPTRSRATVSRRLQTAVTIVTVAALVPVAGMRLEASAAVVPHPNTPIASPALASVSPVIVRPRIAAATIAPVWNVAAPQRRDSTFEQSLPAEPGQRLVLDLDSGGEVILHGWDEPRARLRARLSGRNWRDTRVEFTRVDNGIELRSDFVSSSAETETSHTFELWVPRRSDVKLSSAGGALSIEDLDGRFTGHTGGGAIEIRNARGSSSLTTGGGDINVSRSDLSGTVSTGGGAVMLSQVTGGLRGSSGSGPVIYGEGRSRGGRDRDESRRSDTTADLRTVTISGNRVYTVGSDDRGGASARGGATITNRRSERSSELGPLHISKAGGSITLDDAPEGGTLHTGGGDITIERAGGDLTATTGGGDIELRRVAGSASVITGAGDVHITVVDDEGREHTIEASSGSGTVEVVLPASIDARVELESAYTESFGRRTRVESDWRLERSESADWETVYGTPRKFVRARGTLGSGRGLIRIKTVNGDVIVRRAER